MLTHALFVVHEPTCTVVCKQQLTVRLFSFQLFSFVLLKSQDWINHYSPPVCFVTNQLHSFIYFTVTTRVPVDVCFIHHSETSSVVLVFFFLLFLFFFCYFLGVGEQSDNTLFFKRTPHGVKQPNRGDEIFSLLSNFECQWRLAKRCKT